MYQYPLMMSEQSPTWLPTASETVLEAVADAIGRDVTELTTPLYTVLDPDALDRIFADAAQSSCTVSFQFEGCDIVVTESGAEATPTV